MRVMFLILCACVLAFGQGNWNGWNDTSVVSGFRADSLKYSLAFDVAKYEDIVVLVKFDDTSETGFSSDSLNFRYGFQTGVRTKTSAGVIDTAWRPLLWLDSVAMADIGDVTAGKETGWVDTGTISGWAYQITNVSENAAWEWSPLIRYGFEGLTDNVTGSYVKLVVQHVRRLGTYTNRD